jgi:hypothetical protein
MAIVALCRNVFLRMRGYFLSMRVIFKKISENIFSISKISILFEDIFREIVAFFNYCEGFSKIARFFQYNFSRIDMRLFKKSAAF